MNMFIGSHLAHLHCKSFIYIPICSTGDMACNFECVSSISPMRTNWTIKVRVVRLWMMPPYGHDAKPGSEGSIEMVLCDREVITLVFIYILDYNLIYNINIINCGIGFLYSTH